MTHERPEREQKTIEIEDALVDPYAVLGLERTATMEEIKKAYFGLVRQFQPERAPEEFKRIRAAYDQLRTPEARAATDLFRLRPPIPYQPYKRPPTFTLDYQDEDWARVARAQTDIERADFSGDFRDIEL